MKLVMFLWVGKHIYTHVFLSICCA